MVRVHSDVWSPKSARGGREHERMRELRLGLVLKRACDVLCRLIAVKVHETVHGDGEGRHEPLHITSMTAVQLCWKRGACGD